MHRHTGNINKASAISSIFYLFLFFSRSELLLLIRSLYLAQGLSLSRTGSLQAAQTAANRVPVAAGALTTHTPATGTRFVRDPQPHAKLTSPARWPRAPHAGHEPQYPGTTQAPRWHAGPTVVRMVWGIQASERHIPIFTYRMSLFPPLPWHVARTRSRLPSRGRSTSARRAQGHTDSPPVPKPLSHQPSCKRTGPLTRELLLHAKWKSLAAKNKMKGCCHH